VYFLYSLILFFAFIFYAPVYFFRMKLWRGERLYLRERLGVRLPQRSPAGPSIWIHAVSVGEVLSLRSLLSQIKKRHPSWRVCFSTLTSTGYRIAKDKLPEADSVFLIPLDFAFIVRKFFRALRPQLLVLAESEFWPNLLRGARKNCRATILVNGRISARSFKTYHRLGPLAHKLLQNIGLFLVQTELDAQRIKALGLDPERVKVVGNLKAEVNLPALSQEDIQAFKKNLGIPESKKVIVAGSTHKGEEEPVLKAFEEARRERNDLLLIVAPRHPERAGEVEKISLNLGLKALRKTMASPDQPWDVLVLDTIGELARFYSLADLTFVGGSIVPHGGQNFMEPAFYGKPIFLGPYLDNFIFLADEFIRCGAVQVVSGRQDLAKAFRMKDEASLGEMGKKAKALLDSFQGATEKTLRVIENLMSEARVTTQDQDEL
jgi:3-deoxy-D-manno-octulosonic-acid transferase